MGIDTLQGRRDKARLKWLYKLVTMPADRYPKKLFSKDWNIKPHRGRQRKVWSRRINDLFVSLELKTLLYSCHGCHLLNQNVMESYTLTCTVGSNDTPSKHQIKAYTLECMTDISSFGRGEY